MRKSLETSQTVFAKFTGAENGHNTSEQHSAGQQSVMDVTRVSR